MKPNEVSIANLEQLTDELAAAGWDSTQTNIEDAREAVLNLIAENMVAFLVSKGWAVDETTTLEGAKQMAQFQSFDTFQELVEAHPVCEEAREYSVYRVASHNRNNSPDGRSLCFSGTKFECDEFYNELTHYDRVSDLYLFGTDEDSAVGYSNWKHAGCSY